MTETGTDAEDLKLVILARSARARSGSAEGAAVRDETGRTYAAAPVALPALRLSALALAVAMAISSGAERLEAAAVVTEAASLDAADTDVLEQAGPGALLLLAGPDGVIRPAGR